MKVPAWIRAIALGSVCLVTAWQAHARDDAAALPAKTVVLVHGAFADGSCWSRVIRLLHKRGVKAVAVQNPLASLAGDVDAVKRVIDQQTQPVVLVGHSWGGMVMTEAGVNPKVESLVYVAAFGPDVGMSVASMTGTRPPMPWLEELVPDAAGFLTLTDKGVTEYFAAGLPAADAHLIAAVQGPAFAGTLDDTATQAAWRTKPSWYVRAADDQIIDPELQLEMANRMQARTISVPSGHLPMISHAPVVVAAILAAMRNPSQP